MEITKSEARSMIRSHSYSRMVFSPQYVRALYEIAEMPIPAYLQPIEIPDEKERENFVLSMRSVRLLNPWKEVSYEKPI